MIWQRSYAISPSDRATVKLRYSHFDLDYHGKAASVAGSGGSAMIRATSAVLKGKLDQATRMLACAIDPADKDWLREDVRELERLFEAAADREHHKPE